MSRLFNFKSVGQLQAFVKEIKSLKVLVNCPVCLEVTQNPVRIVCDHIFCSNCLDTFINTFRDQAPKKIPKCPICRKAMNRRRTSVSGYVESLLLFLQGVDASLHSTFGCDILALDNMGLNKFFERKMTTLDSSSHNVIASTCNEQNDFDRLINSDFEKPVFKKKYGKNYTRKSSKTVIPEAICISTFENNDTKRKIQQWLEDTKNQFDRLTQSQTPSEKGQTQLSLNLPSISQVNCGQTSQQQKSMKRPRSFELKSKLTLKEVKSHSFTGQSQELLEDVAIAELENETTEIPYKEQVLVRLLEEECLNNIDLELGVNHMNEESKLRELNHSNSINSNTINKNGWKRMRKINKTINKKSKKKKALKVTLTSPIDKENITVKKKRNRRKKHPLKPVVILKRLPSDVEYSNINGKITKTTTKNQHKNGKEVNDNNMEIEHIANNVTESIIVDSDDTEDFTGNATKLSSKKHKAVGSFIFSDDQCSVQCFKDTIHEDCRISIIEAAIPKDLNRSIVDDAEQTIRDLITFCGSQRNSLNKPSLEKLKTLLPDLNEIVNGAEMSKTISFDVKSISVQTDTAKKHNEQNKSFCSVDTQTDYYTCKMCNKIDNTQFQSSQNSNLTPSKSHQIEINDDNYFDFKTQEVNNGNVTTERVHRSPLVATQKIYNESDEQQNQEDNVNILQMNSTSRSLQNVEASTKPSGSTVKSTLASELLFSISNQKNNSKEDCEKMIAQVSKTYKRIRTLDVDSDEESLAKKNKVENKYLVDNLSIEMISENIADDNTPDLKSTTNSGLSLNNCSDVDYDSYLVNIMKKYETTPSPSKLTLKKSTKNDSQDVLDRCDAMIREVTSLKHTNTNKNQKQKLNNDLRTNAIQTHKNEDEDNIVNITVRESPIDLEMMQEFDEPFDQQPSYSNDKEPNSLPCTEALMANLDIDSLESSIDNNSDLNNTVIPGLSGTHRKVSKADSSRNMPNVVILNDVLLDPIKEVIQKAMEEDGRSTKSEDLFNSENDEIADDLIERTPTKTSQVIGRSFSTSLRRKSLLNKFVHLPPLAESPDVISSIEPTSFLDQTFTPPVNFQDEDNEDAIAPIITNTRSNHAKGENNPIDLDEVNSQDFVSAMTLPKGSTKAKKNLIDKNKANVIDLNNINTQDFDETMIAKNLLAKKLNGSTVRNRVTTQKLRPTKETYKSCGNDGNIIELDAINSEDFDITLVPSNIKRKKDKDEIDLSVTESELMRLINTQKSAVFTSTQEPHAIHNFETLGISPIQKVKKKNPIEITKGAKFSPLNVISVAKPEVTSKLRPPTPLATKQKSILSFVKADKLEKDTSITSIGSSDLSPSPATKPYVICTRLPKEHTLIITALSKKKLIHYTNTYSPQVTHIVVSVNKKNCLQDHTVKLLLAITYGKWVVNTNWIKDCLTHDRIMPEEDYEVLDMSGIPGPKTSRLKGKTKLLLKGYKIHLEPPFLATSEQVVEEMITALGGQIISNIETLHKLGGIRLIISEANSSEDYCNFEQWYTTYNVMVVDIEWLSRSIGQYQVVSLRPFALCSEDRINSLGYPPELTVEAAFSYSQSAYQAIALP